MRIVIAGGNHEADFIIHTLKKAKHKLLVINEDAQLCKYLSAQNGIAVYNGDPTKKYSLEEAGVTDFDVLVSLSESDNDNYVVCAMGKQMFNIKKCVCLVKNPKNVELFRSLGIDSVISSTYLLAQFIRNESTIENVVKTLSIEDEQIVITEIDVEADFLIAGKTIIECQFPQDINISCIFRKPRVIIVNGSTVIQAKDRLVVVSTPKEQQNIIEFIQRKK